ncbi:MAG: hypothetical protein O2816_16390, partial [Planctomycetota bacterium]|nr:hypothetical protein [Planctomycetota bacterium]
MDPADELRILTHALRRHLDRREVAGQRRTGWHVPGIAGAAAEASTPPPRASAAAPPVPAV